MKPKHIARAKRFIGKRWYWRLRALKNRRMYAIWDKYITVCDNKDVPACCHELERLARKEAYYATKMNKNEDTGEHTDR